MRAYSVTVNFLVYAQDESEAKAEVTRMIDEIPDTPTDWDWNFTEVAQVPVTSI